MLTHIDKNHRGEQFKRRRRSCFAPDFPRVIAKRENQVRKSLAGRHPSLDSFPEESTSFREGRVSILWIVRHCQADKNAHQNRDRRNN